MRFFWYVGLPGVLLAGGTGLAAAQAGQAAQRATLTGSPDTAFVVVHLREEGSSCAVIHKTDTVRVSKAKKPFVEFIIVNDCAAQVYVSITDLSHHTTPGAADPIETPAGERRRTAPGNHVSNNLRIRIRSDATEGRWDYNLRINDEIVDPKIDIEA